MDEMREHGAKVELMGQRAEVESQGSEARRGNWGSACLGGAGD